MKRVKTIKLDGFWCLLDVKKNAIISERKPSGKVSPVRSKTKRLIDIKAEEWEELLIWNEVYEKKEEK